MAISGKKIADDILNKLKAQKLPEKYLAAIVAGGDVASVSFVKQKEKTAKALGVDFRIFTFLAEISQDILREEVVKIASEENCGGILVQLPLPEQIDKYFILNAIPREKDVDVLGEEALGAFYAGRNLVLPPSVAALQEILKNIDFTLSSAKVAVVGLGFLVGKPISIWLENKCNELILLDKGSDFLALRDADLIITGIGHAGIIKPDMLKVEATVIDFGYDSSAALTTSGGRGDFDSSSLSTTHYSLSTITYTPTPGGTGPILVAKLLENFYILNIKTS